MNVEIRYPVLSFNSIKLEMTEDEYETIKAKSREDTAKWIVEQDEKLDFSNAIDEIQMYHALHNDYATIQAIR